MDTTDADGLDVRVVLRDAEGALMGTGTGTSAVVTVPDVHPWAPGDGYLYDLEVQLVDAAGARRQLEWIGATSFRTSHYPYSKTSSTSPTGTASS